MRMDRTDTPANLRWGRVLTLMTIVALLTAGCSTGPSLYRELNVTRMGTRTIRSAATATCEPSPTLCEISGLTT